MRHSTTLYSAQQGHTELRSVWEFVKPWLVGGHRLTVSIKTETRSTAQNAKFHAICDDIAKSGATWAGKARTPAEWKVLLVSGHAVATKEGADVVPGLEGEFINLRESTALMSVSRSSSLIEYAIAWCASANVRLSVGESEYA